LPIKPALRPALVFFRLLSPLHCSIWPQAGEQELERGVYELERWRPRPRERGSGVAAAPKGWWCGVF